MPPSGCRGVAFGGRAVHIDRETANCRIPVAAEAHLFLVACLLVGSGANASIADSGDGGAGMLAPVAASLTIAVMRRSS